VQIFRSGNESATFVVINSDKTPKYMKFFATLSLFLAFAMAGSVNAQSIINSDEVNVVIAANTSRGDLAKLRQDLRAVGIDFMYRPEFTEDRRIRSISYTLTDAGTGVKLGEITEQKDLSVQGSSSRFHLRHENGAFRLICLGESCE
jgi:hypothetical protein